MYELYNTLWIFLYNESIHIIVDGRILTSSWTKLCRRLRIHLEVQDVFLIILSEAYLPLSIWAAPFTFSLDSANDVISGHLQRRRLTFCTQNGGEIVMVKDVAEAERDSLEPLVQRILCTPSTISQNVSRQNMNSNSLSDLSVRGWRPIVQIIHQLFDLRCQFDTCIQIWHSGQVKCVGSVYNEREAMFLMRLDWMFVFVIYLNNVSRQ